MVTPQNRAALTACRRILMLVHAIRPRGQRRSNKDGVVIDLLLDKAEKTARAVLLLVTRGYAEDGLVLARSLAGLAIDVSYLSAKDSDRFVSYRATGLEARRRMAEQCGFPAPHAAASNWKDVKKRAQRWQRGGAIYERAMKSDCLRLYQYAYRHGSSFEHSDAWSLLTYEPENASARDVVLHLALLVVAYSLAKAYQAWSRFFAVDDPTTEEAIKKHFLAAFPAPPASQALL
jgi:hypothetical protein